MDIIIDDGLSKVYVVRNWLQIHDKDDNTDLAEQLYDYIIDNVELVQSNVTVRGKTYLSPRLNAFQGNSEVKYHRYSGNEHIVDDWSPLIEIVTDLIRDEFHIPFNSSIIQFYENGNNYIGYHSDKEISGDYNNLVIGLSLGGTRRFYLQRKIRDEDRKLVTMKTIVNHGDLLIMEGDTQKYWKHSVPKQANVEPRISITWRILQNYL